jgi:thymidylate synthase
MSASPFTIEDMNLSEAWVAALKKILATGRSEISPLVLTLTDFTEVEIIRATLDNDLANHKLPTIDTVSETIFPVSLYEYAGYNRDKLYIAYKRNLPRLKKIDSSNAHGTYFERLIAFEGNNKVVNQLDIIIESLVKSNVKRRSKLQASIFDPTKDHSDGAFQGFPCLQHVTFYKSKEGGLILNSFYAIQYLYRRAYGNWLGLINLGKFVARETGLEFERFNCFIGVEKLDVGNLKRSEAKKFLAEIDQKTFA